MFKRKPPPGTLTRCDHLRLNGYDLDQAVQLANDVGTSQASQSGDTYPDLPRIVDAGGAWTPGPGWPEPARFLTFEIDRPGSMGAVFVSMMPHNTGVDLLVGALELDSPDTIDCRPGRREFARAMAGRGAESVGDTKEARMQVTSPPIRLDVVEWVLERSGLDLTPATWHFTQKSLGVGYALKLGDIVNLAYKKGRTSHRGEEVMRDPSTFEHPVEFYRDMFDRTREFVPWLIPFVQRHAVRVPAFTIAANVEDGPDKTLAQAQARYAEDGGR